VGVGANGKDPNNLGVEIDFFWSVVTQPTDPTRHIAVTGDGDFQFEINCTCPITFGTFDVDASSHNTPPIDFTASAGVPAIQVTNTGATISFSSPVGGSSSLQVSVNGGDWTEVQTFSDASWSFDVSGLQVSASYNFRVCDSNLCSVGVPVNTTVPVPVAGSSGSSGTSGSTGTPLNVVSSTSSGSGASQVNSQISGDVRNSPALWTVLVFALALMGGRLF